ncbi:unnamed protein product, partial [marine sediment metagenome]
GGRKTMAEKNDAVTKISAALLGQLNEAIARDFRWPSNICGSMSSGVG